MSSSIPKAVLYYYPKSIWCASVLLTLEEKGYGPDEIDRKQVDLGKGENFDPTFLRLNPKATVPTLIVPFEDTLTEDVESRYKALTETESIIEFLDKSRSATSRTNTTSTAPAPAFAPATIAFANKSKVIISYLHSDEGNPNHLRYVNARDSTALKSLSDEILPSMTGKHQALARYISEAEEGKLQVSEKTKSFWREKKAEVDVLLGVIQHGHKGVAELDQESQDQRAHFYSKARKAWETELKTVLTKIDDEIIGPYSLGDQLSIADLHLASWLARLVKLSGGAFEDDGNTAIEKLERHIGGGFALSRNFQVENEQGATVTHSKLGAFWDAMKNRSSWKIVYGDGIY